VIHNASFDMSFINAELIAAGKPVIDMEQVIDTLAIAKTKFPMASNSLDALCKRFGVDNSKRTKHGALLDSELLAEVYLELVGGRQTALGWATPGVAKRTITAAQQATSIRTRPQPLPLRLTESEQSAHAALVLVLGDKSLWPKPAA
jgi:DNA polymerase III subunit epsilon